MSDERRRSGWKSIREWVVVIVTAIIIATVLRTFVVQQLYRRPVNGNHPVR
jgi:low affinity Fe/Cu permease